MTFSVNLMQDMKSNFLGGFGLWNSLRIHIFMKMERNKFLFFLFRHMSLEDVRMFWNGSHQTWIPLTSNYKWSKNVERGKGTLSICRMAELSLSRTFDHKNLFKVMSADSQNSHWNVYTIIRVCLKKLPVYWFCQ